MGKNPSRRLIALIAAYAVALQALVLPFSLAANGGSPPPCSVASAAGDDAGAAGHAPDCVCAAGCGMLCCGYTLAAPPQISVVVILQREKSTTPITRHAGLVLAAPSLVHAPRGPPAA